MNEQEANSVAMACLARVALVTSMDRLRATVNAIVGVYEEQAARRQYDILGDGSV